MALSRPQHLAFSLLDALVREDVDDLDRVVSEINGENDDGVTVHGVLACVSALLVGSLVGVHGSVGALAQIDRARAEHEDLSASW